VLAFQAMNSAVADPHFLLAVELSAIQVPPVAEQSNLAFNEVAAANGPSFFVELLNHGTTDAPLSGCRIVSSRGGQFRFGAQTLRAGRFLALDTHDLGFTVRAGDLLFLYGDGLRVIDGVKVRNELLGRLPSAPTGAWLVPWSPSPGTTNPFRLHDEIMSPSVNSPPSRPANCCRTRISRPTRLRGVCSAITRGRTLSRVPTTPRTPCCTSSPRVR